MNSEESEFRPRQELTQEQAEALMIEEISSRIQHGAKRLLEYDDGISFSESFPRYASLALFLDAHNHPILGKRATAPHAGQYSLIGGKIDQNIGNRPVESETSQRFHGAQLESPTEALVREIAEEVYPDLLDDLEKLQSLLNPRRFCIVYDHRTNWYCSLYTAKLFDSARATPDPREISDMKPLGGLTLDEINPLTQFALKKLGYSNEIDGAIMYGAITKMAMPEDIFRFISPQKRGEQSMVVPSHTLNEEGFLITYP